MSSAVTGRAALRAVLAEAARTSVVVLSTHQTEDVAALCERVATWFLVIGVCVAALIAAGSARSAR